MSMKTKTIRQRIAFKASPHDVYEMLMNATQHSHFTGASARISRKVGGAFSVYDGYATGKNLTLIKDKKIVQTWRTTEWEEGHYSTVEFLLSPSRRGCILTFTQKDVPLDQYAALQQGWKDYYWTPMKKMLENG
jgi:activator of HSP90 ATPase